MRRTEVRWLYYSPLETEMSRSVEEFLGKHIPADCLERVYGIRELGAYFSTPRLSLTHVFLFANIKEDLLAVKEHQQIIFEMKCFIGTTNRWDKQLTDTAFEFHPRFIVYLPWDLAFLESILKKIAGNAR
jgi:hypothetical protein